MEMEALIALCHEQGLELQVSEGQLEIYFDDEPTPQLLDLLKAHKSELTQYLGEISRVAENRFSAENGKAHPLSFGQQQLWFIQQLDGSTAQYNIFNAFRFQGKFDESLAERAFGVLIERHEALRTTYHEVDGVARPEILESAAFHLDRIDLRELASENQGAALTQAMQAHAAQSFDLGMGPVVRAGIFRTGVDAGVLMITVHHIAADGWSLGLLVKEFVQTYTAFAQGVQARHAPLSASYGDFVHWQRKTLESPSFQARLDAYEQRMKNLPLVHSLPLDYPRGEASDFAGDVVHARVSAPSLNRLRDVGNRCGATLFMSLHAVFSIMMSRYSYESDIVIGTPVANRARKEFEPIVGLFANVLVLRTTVEESLSFTEYLGDVRNEDLAALEQQDVPFHILVERLNPPRSAAIAPLFQVMFSMNNLAIPAFELPEVDLVSLVTDSHQSKYDLTLNVIEENGALTVGFEYQTGLFRRETIEGMAACFCALVDQVGLHPDSRVGDLYWEDPATHDAWVAGLIRASEATLPGPTIDQVFIARVGERRDEIAVQFRDETITYGELHERSEQLALALRARGVGPDVPVGIFCHRSIGMIVALLAILKAGGAYVPLDPTYPDARLEQIVEDSALGQLLTQSSLIPRCTQWDVEPLVLDDEVVLQECAAYAGTAVPRFVRSDADLAYVIYTSGSTGRPKGVMVEHRNVRHIVEKTCRVLNAGEAVWLGLATICFDMSVLEIWGALLCGARLVVAPDQRLAFYSSHEEYDAEPPDLLLGELMARAGVTHMQATPSLYKILLSDPQSSNILENLEAVLTGGEPCSADLGAQLVGATRGKVYNMYGPTEATVWATYNPLHVGMSSIPLGQPIPGYTLLVTDAARRPCPPGMPGELLIAGPGVTRGYRNRDQLTRERFIALDAPGGERVRAYCTGDLVRYDHLGRLHFLGRLDTQVKIRGFRIELGDIEAQLRQHPDLVQAACVVHSFGADDQRLGAYVVRHASARGSAKQLIAELQEMLAERLPKPMVPSFFVLLESLPLTQSGKLDRKALPAPVVEQVVRDTQRYVAPATDTERTMAQIWAQILKVDPAVVSAELGFFEMGGHSISLMLLLSSIQSQFGVSLGVREAFKDPSVKGLAAMVDGKQAREACVQ
jgi:amino acid adenylation domain-containing protein